MGPQGPAMMVVNLSRVSTGPTVLFVAGSGRSGSTLLERTLGAVPGWVATGELLDLPRRVAPADERCGCGEPFSACPFWSAVAHPAGAALPLAPHTWDPAWLAETRRLQAGVARQRHLPTLLLPILPARVARELASYTGRVAALYAAAASVAGADVVVDASKWPSLAWALHRGGLDVRVVHLVRDVRGVTHSLAKDVERPHDDGTPMYRNAPAEGALRWLATQSELDLLARRGLPVARLRYDDFVRDPAGAITDVVGRLGIVLPVGGLAHIHGTEIELGPSHGLSGNPSRFRHGTVRLRADDAWREHMPRRTQLMTTALALPQHLRHQANPVAEPTWQARAAALEVEQWPLVSVVLPTHGRPEMVREALASAIAQTYPGNLEIVLVHDREDTDPSLQELSVPGRSVLVVGNTRTPGLAGARNTGLELVKGDLVASLDDDDHWHPTKIELQVRRLLAEPDLLMVGTGLRLLLAGGATANWPGRSEHIAYETLLRNRVKELHSSTLMFRREVFTMVGPYDEELPHGYGEDWDIVIRVARAGSVGVVTTPLASIRKDGQSYYVGRAERTVVALQVFLDRHPEITADRRGHARLLGQLGYQQAVLGDRARGAATAARGVARWPFSPHPYVALVQAAAGVDPSRVQKLARRLGRGMA